MNELVLKLNVIIFITTLVCLCMPYRQQINIFTGLCLITLGVLSWHTLVIYILLSVIVYNLVKVNSLWAYQIAIVLNILVFILLQSLSKQNLMTTIGSIYLICRQIHFIFESYKCKLKNITLWKLIRYQTFLPCVVAGPIHRVAEFETELNRRHFSWLTLSNGIELLIAGHFKVIVLGHIISLALLEPNQIKYTHSILEFLKLYIVFSGFTDIARGYGYMLGIRLPPNFNNPLFSHNIQDFWQRWHMSLTQWCQNYVFTPLYAKFRSFLIASIITMVVIGLWHEFSFRYVLWGIYHGLGIAVFRYYRENLIFKMPRVLSTLLTLIFVISSYEITSFLNKKILALL